MTDILSITRTRGFLQDATPGLAERLARGPVTGYVGFDPTADSLHIGNLVPVMGLAWLQRSGSTPVILVGGGTGMVGDPSGKRAERPVMTREQVDANAAAIRSQLERFLSFEGSNAARVFNNADWPMASAVTCVMVLLLLVPLVYFQYSQVRQQRQAGGRA